jgi:hypothetical protein
MRLLEVLLKIFLSYSKNMEDARMGIVIENVIQIFIRMTN